jgi:uncharacterized protein (DUF305 family)
MNTLVRSGAAALAAALTLTLAACAGTSGTATNTSAAASTTSAGGSATSLPSAMMSGSPMMSGSAKMAPAASAEHNAADLAFAQQMIVHHQGAVEMAELAPSRAADQQVKDLAARINAAQAPEIEQMTGWLTLWGAAMSTTSAATTDDGMGDMDHGGMSGMGNEGEMSSGASSGMAMPGMMSDTQMQQLTAATGADFDRLFLQLMIMHHQGAIEMADTEIAQGSNPAALALAESIKTSQTAEITEMQQLLVTR